MSDFAHSPRIIKTYYWKDKLNAGDLLTGLIVKRLFHEEILWSSPVSCELLGIGSILEQITIRRSHIDTAALPLRWMKSARNIFRRVASPSTPLFIWSAGFLNWPQREPVSFYRKNMVFSAVRGKLTLDLIEKLYGPIPAPILGDGGLLASLLIDKVSKKYPIGIVPHYTEAGSPNTLRLQRHYKNAKLIDPRNNPIQFVEEIASCETILSSSLHGLIIADSFNIPNRHVGLSAYLMDRTFKYRDYYSAFNLPYVPINIRNDNDYPTIEQVQNEYPIKYSNVIEKQTQLIKSFPFQ